MKRAFKKDLDLNKSSVGCAPCIEEVYKIDFTSLSDGLQNHLVRISKNQKQNLEQEISRLKENLSNDKQLRIAILSTLLKRELNE